MFSLKINDIKNWLIENRNDFQKLKNQEFPPYDNALYSMYGHLKDFIEYYNLKSNCENALVKLKAKLNADFIELSTWTKDYEILGSQELLMFEVNYINWNERVSDNKIKIHEGLYIEKKPFVGILCFCKVFQHLYWDNSIHETDLTEEEQLVIYKDLQNIFDKYYFDTAQE